jgi:RNA polymerase sigma factor for flagellar operon FliA
MTAQRQSGLALIQRPREVEASLWRRLRYEDQGHCRELLFNRHIALAKAIAGREYRRRPPHGSERADFEQLAMTGLLEAIDRFDPLLGPPFSAFAKYRIRGAIADGMSKSSEGAAQYNFRRRSEGDRLRSLSENGDATTADPIFDLTEIAVGLAIGLIAERAATMAALEANPYESSSWRDIEIRVMSEIEALPDAQRSVMIQHYMHGMPFNEIAVLLRLSKGRISQLHRAAIMRLRDSLKGPE